MSDKRVIEAAVDWYMARTAFLKLTAGHPEARSCLDRLANAEDALARAVREGVKAAFLKPIPNEGERMVDDYTGFEP